ncbi:restriction endonuclease subunit S [uncultured Clostridium sp.]|uniref:restriction endonuclease subunit S n=1 Tax=uncultured Clostridium sp. TaxID=59620 RepID=UPI0025919B00|nr:restriction endonuclease subunit S [uncultured Clostridium sp.]
MERNVPKLRFKEFNDEWIEYKLGEKTCIYDGTHQTPKYTDHGVKFVSVENIEDIYGTDKFISEEDYENGFKIKPQLGDIFMTRITAGVIGATAIVDKEEELAFYVSLALIRVIDKNLNSLFLKKYIESIYFKKELNKRIIHVAFPKKINLGDIGECSVNLPSLQEQERIANFLTKVDKIIEKQDEKVRNLEKYKKGMMQKIFSQEIRFKDENGEEYPEWENKNLGELGETYTGLSGKTKENFGVGTSKFITYMNVFKNIKVNFSMLDLVEVGENEKQNKVIKNDLLFTTSSETPEEVGMVSVCTENIENLYLNSFCFGFRINDKESVNSEFMSYLLRSPENRLKISTLAQGSTRYNLSKSELMKMKIKIPCIEEQNSIVKLLNNIDCISINEQEKLLELKQWKKGFLQQMFV